MNREFENSGREMPYRLPPQSLEALHERILSRTSRRPASPPRTVRRYCLTAAAAAAVLVMGLLVTEYRTRRADTSISPQLSVDRPVVSVSTTV